MALNLEKQLLFVSSSAGIYGTTTDINLVWSLPQQSRTLHLAHAKISPLTV